MTSIARTLTAGALAATAVVGGIATTATPAHAATALTFCFTWSQTGAAYAGYGVDLWQVTSTGAWVQKLRSGKTNSAGCGTFTATPSSTYLRLYANVQAGGHAWGGATDLFANPGAGTVSLGRAYVYPIY